jgi:predicted GNAT family N-acyltransferase
MLSFEQGAVVVDVTLRFISVDDAAYTSECDLRFRVLRAPLGMTRDQVAVTGEADALHLVAVRDGVVVGCVLLHQQEDARAQLRQMAVDASLQGTGLGRRLVHALEERADELGVTTIHLHARDTALGFYEKLGYAVEGEPFEEVGVAHHAMVKRIGARDA